MIRLGSQGAEVKAWQQYLVSIDYDVDVDGIFGQDTHNATIEFQKWCKIDADGIVGAGSYSWAASNGYTGGYTA